MNIKMQLVADMKTAMRNKDKSFLTTIRMMIDRIQKKEKDLLRDLSEDEVIQVIQTYKKQVNEQIEDYRKVGNYMKIAGLTMECNLIDNYLPKQLNEDEINMIVSLAISGLAKNGHAINKGSVMKEVMPKVKGKADNKLVNEVVTRLLEVIGR